MKTVHAQFCTDIGRLRTTNQDNLYFNGMFLDRNCAVCSGDEEFLNYPMLFAVCDGMGGESHGDEAAYIAVKMLAACQPVLVDGVHSAMDSYTVNANGEILKLGRAGTTLASVILEENTATVAHLGDSRAYLFRDTVLTRLTEDHTQKRSSGSYGAEKSRCHVLTRHLGMDLPELVVRPSYNRFAASSGDLILLCSDGLTDMLDDNEISAILNSSQKPASALVNAALKNGGEDNVTVVVVLID